MIRTLAALAALLCLGAMAHADALKQSSTQSPLLIHLVLASDEETPVTGATPTVTLSKAGASFAAPAGAVSEVGSGWYKVAANATDTNTLGPLIVHATAATAAPADAVYTVVAYDPQDGTNLGLATLTNAAKLIEASGAVSDGSSTTTVVDTALSSTTTDFYKGCFLLFTSGALSGSAYTVQSYNGSNHQLTLLSATPSAAASGDTFLVAVGVPRKLIDQMVSPPATPANILAATIDGLSVQDLLFDTWVVSAGKSAASYNGQVQTTTYFRQDGTTTAHTTTLTTDSNRRPISRTLTIGTLP